MEILYLEHNLIDKKKWDQLINQVPGNTLYAQSWYLDAVCPGWQALATPDYSIVMPLTCKKKLGLPYLYQPILSQQLGIFSNYTIDSLVVDSFIRSIPKKFRLIEITLNGTNAPGKDYPVDNHTTYKLDLQASYEQIVGRFSENTKRNIRKANQHNLRFRTNIPAGTFIDLLGKDTSAGAKILTLNKHRPALVRLITDLTDRQSAIICGVKNRHEDLLAAALIGQHQGTHYYLAPAMNPAGREARAMFLLIDRYIHLNAGLPVTLDFEGSDIPSVARFYQGFGSSPTTYTSLRMNLLPWPIRLWADRKVH